jgi:hypothetical protein
VFYRRILTTIKANVALIHLRLGLDTICHFLTEDKRESDDL